MVIVGHHYSDIVVRNDKGVRHLIINKHLSVLYPVWLCLKPNLFMPHVIRYVFGMPLVLLVLFSLSSLIPSKAPPNAHSLCSLSSSFVLQAFCLYHYPLCDFISLSPLPIPS